MVCATTECKLCVPYSLPQPAQINWAEALADDQTPLQTGASGGWQTLTPVSGLYETC